MPLPTTSLIRWVVVLRPALQLAVSGPTAANARLIIRARMMCLGLIANYLVEELFPSSACGDNPDLCGESLHVHVSLQRLAVSAMADAVRRVAFCK